MSEVGSVARAVDLYAKLLPTQKNLLSQLTSLDGKRLLCHCSVNSPCHVDAVITVWRNHRLPKLVRVRSMWQVCVDNLDVLETCDWADLQELAESGQHEGIVVARERYKRFQVLRSPGMEVTRSLPTKSLGDHIDGYQGVIGPPDAFVRELIHFTLATLQLSQVGRKWMQILAGRWGRVFQFRRECVSCLNEMWKFLYSFHGRQILSSAVRQELWSALMLLLLCRADLRVPVDPMATASDASLTGGAICRSTGLTVRGLGAWRVAQTQQTSLCDDEVVLICVNDCLGAGRRALELLRLGVSGLVRLNGSVAMLGLTSK